MKHQVIAIIPARYASSRFPGKMLATILGKSLLQRTYECVMSCRLIHDVLIATDDEKIIEACKSFGAKAFMTRLDHPTGTDRLIEVLEKFPEETNASIILNVQGDEPCISANTLQAVCQQLIDNPEELMATAAVRIQEAHEIHSPAVVKVVVDRNQHALYFSRATIPGVHPKSSYAPYYYKHLGIYAFRRDFLLRYGQLERSPLQQIEDLEQLKVLEAGYKIKVAYVEQSSPAVDLPEDIQRVTEWLCSQNSYS